MSAPLRPELQIAHDELDAQEGFFAYTACLSFDAKAWAVQVRKGKVYFALESRYSNCGNALAAGAHWLKTQFEGPPDANRQKARRAHSPVATPSSEWLALIAFLNSKK